MIRRQLSDDRYLLIRQPEHARVAGEIARKWDCDWLHNFPLSDELMFAIAHHDDGWMDWEKSPDLEPSSQLPRSFTEMETETSIGISRKSIQLGTEHSKATGFWVSQHFQRLASQRRLAKDISIEDAKTLDEFCAEQNELQTNVQHDSQIQLSNQDLLLGTEWLRFFDHVSLLLCCRLPTEPDTIAAPNVVESTIHQTQTDDLNIEVEFSAGLSTELSIVAAAGILKPGGTPQTDVQPVSVEFHLTLGRHEI